MQTDQEIIAGVINEALSASGPSLAARAMCLLLGQLIQRHGAKVTVEGAIDALDRMITAAEIAKSELRLAKNLPSE